MRWDASSMSQGAHLWQLRLREHPCRQRGAADEARLTAGHQRGRDGGEHVLIGRMVLERRTEDRLVKEAAELLRDAARDVDAAGRFQGQRDIAGETAEQ